MERSPLIMVFGISGVGKTTACLAYVDAHPNYLYDRASAILQKAHGIPVEALRIGPASSVIENQAVLPSAVRALRKAEPSRTILLDSHAVIDNDTVFVEVPLDIIMAIEPDGFILLEAAPATIKQRREEASRPRPQRSVAQIGDEAQAERKAVTSYAKALGKPLIIDAVSEPQYDLQPAIDRLSQRIMLRAFPK
ncbi:archaeal adenylate kinase [Mesorhizobium australicum WSM2073]|uniref:Archaeal adenylate kinase n=1 Tax=Mesorhizobium australicum (strain HAMBI 3006 / LMG 24608 / WSM2073) TaxID=754035 RepID=L0KML8_MESAW|nr:AAA family ATPase [Mesorhizobium australicum]AGB45323.1 archaeal adenylate kinase [Mesorhizobium australicum WSM2073]